ncbi:hypothetical protein [Xanthomonas floridensis]|uniref:Uncharacterized protein n=1 Tax=Xanthomonas floridensis TaxID=1843580 RepID=A0A1A9MBP2_9XANT|nr:hypothetical protein [Xanthomonas floridensis]MEA5125153.1 hypothetical protein [Xanthomonas floridensis]MEA5132870.1 hypothetical protein [Xanthomonas floridensis]OAG67469.1 hypothetical protein A7D17_16950 [Xanthomonas floridensis]
MVIFLGSYQLICHAAPSLGTDATWSADWRIEQISTGRKTGELAGATLASTFPDHRSAMSAARIAGMVTLEAMHAETQRQLDYS